MDRKRQSQIAKKHPRETNPSALRPGMMRLVHRRIVSKGEVNFPCVPALLDAYVAQLLGAWQSLGKPFSEEETANLRSNMDRALQTGYQASPYARLVIEYQTQKPPDAGLNYSIRLKEYSMDEHYAHWLAYREPPLFGKHPDAKVLDVAAQLGERRFAPVIDVGAGTGRNALPLAKLGHPTDVIECVPEFADEIRKAATTNGVSIEVSTADILDAEHALKPSHYKLIVLAEVIASHFREVEEVRAVFAKFADALAPGGMVLANVFLAMDGYKPDLAARQISHTAWSCIFTRSDLAFITDELPFDRISDESVHDYERDHLPAEEWPPTDWFVNWTQGKNVFAVDAGRAPVELRWLVYRKR